jgi:AraC family transcriptional regulator
LQDIDTGSGAAPGQRPNGDSVSRPEDSGIRLVDHVTGRPFPTAAGSDVVLASRTRAWWQSPLVFEVHQMSSHAYEEHTTEGHQLMINFGGPVPIGWLEDARRRESLLHPDHLCIQSDGDSNAPRWQGALTFATASIAPDAVDELLGEQAPPSAELFPKRHCVAASTAAGFARALARELSAPTEPLYSETLALAFLLHLTATYGRSSMPKSLAPKGRLGPMQLRTVVDFIHAHLSSRITLPTLARTTGYSPFQFARLFKATTGHPPHQFVMSLRLQRARRMLDRLSSAPSAEGRIAAGSAGGEGTIAQVALAVGFYDQAHFTNAFRAAHGLTPTAYISGRRTS